MTAGRCDDTLAGVTASPQPPRIGAVSRRSRIAPVVTFSALAVVLAAVISGCGGQSATTKPTRTSTTASTPAQTGTSTTTTPAQTGTSTPPTSSTTTTTAPPPPTVINSNCKPPAQHPSPVVLVPGTYGDTSWQLIGPQLATLGYCVYTMTYSNNETGEISTSAQQLGSFVNSVLARTGASRVSVVGHSEGGMVPRYYIKFLGGAAKVDKLVALAPSNHGTLNPATFGGVLTGCIACAQQQTGSALLTKLNSGDETPPQVDYTVIETMYDEVVVPYTSAFLDGPSTRVTNVILQQQCPRDFVGHLGITTDSVALQWVENALASKGPANADLVPSC